MGLKHDTLPMIEYHKAKRLQWDPRQIDFSADHADWAALSELDRDGTLSLCNQFLAGETAVTHDLAPLLIGIRKRGGRLEDEIFLATQLYEEAKHTEFFDRWLHEVIGQEDEADEYLSPSYRTLFLERLPSTLNACLDEPSTLNLALASVTYHIIIEGVMAETGYHVFTQAMKRRNLFPGLLEGVKKVQQDEARHLAFGLYLIASLIEEEPTIWPALVIALNEGLMLATNTLSEAFARWHDKMPFDLSPNDVIQFAARQFMKRYAVLQRAAAPA